MKTLCVVKQDWPVLALNEGEHMRNYVNTMKLGHLISPTPYLFKGIKFHHISF